MSKMIERVAKSLCADGLGADDRGNPCGKPGDCALCIGAARTAIKAMRDPTDEMCDAGNDSDFIMWSSEEGDGVDGTVMSIAWNAMIDYALL